MSSDRSSQGNREPRQFDPEDVAERVHGVRDLHNHLRIQPQAANIEQGNPDESSGGIRH